MVRIRNRLVQLGQGRFQQRLWGSHTSHTLHLGSKIASNKQYAHRLLSALGLPLAMQEWAGTPEKAVAAAEMIGYPVVVKPNRGSMGQGVSVGVTDAAGVRAAFDLAAPGGIPLVQNYIPGDDHRMLVINGELIGVVKRVPAQVVGDGVSSVEALVEVANRDPRRGPGHRRALTFLALDERAERMLARRGSTATACRPRARSSTCATSRTSRWAGYPWTSPTRSTPTTARWRCEPRSPWGSTSSVWTT